MKPQFYAMAVASLGVMAAPDPDECPEEHVKPFKGDVFTYESPNPNLMCDSVTITFPDGDPSQELHANISGNTGPCAKPEQVITLPDDISGLMRFDWQCAGRLPLPCRIFLVKDQPRPGLSNNAAASFAVQQNCPSATTAASSMPTVGGASTFRTTLSSSALSAASSAAPPASSSAAPPASSSAAPPAASSAAPPAASSAAPPEPSSAAPPEPSSAAPPEPSSAAPPEPSSAAPPEPSSAAPPEPSAATSSPAAPVTTAAPPTTTSNMSAQPNNSSPPGCTCTHS